MDFYSAQNEAISFQNIFYFFALLFQNVHTTPPV